MLFRTCEKTDSAVSAVSPVHVAMSDLTAAMRVFDVCDDRWRRSKEVEMEI